MFRLTQKEIKRMLSEGEALPATFEYMIAKNFKQIAYSCGVYGCNGFVVRDNDNGTLYAYVGRGDLIYLL